MIGRRAKTFRIRLQDASTTPRAQMERRFRELAYQRWGDALMIFGPGSAADLRAWRRAELVRRMTPAASSSTGKYRVTA